MNNENEGSYEGTMFSVGCFLTFAVCALVANYSETYVHKMQARIDSVTKLCEQLGSSPRSFDTFTVTCENGTEVSYKVDKNAT